MPSNDPRVTKRRVTGRRVTMGADGTVYTEERVDYVRPDFLDAYLEVIRPEWQHVEVSDTPDAGPAGFDGATYVPAVLAHELAGTYYPATDCGPDCTHAPAGATVVVDGAVVNVVPSEG